jgi:hypothetical protein
VDDIVVVDDDVDLVGSGSGIDDGSGTLVTLAAVSGSESSSDAEQATRARHANSHAETDRIIRGATATL